MCFCLLMSNGPFGCLVRGNKFSYFCRSDVFIIYSSIPCRFELKFSSLLISYIFPSTFTAFHIPVNPMPSLAASTVTYISIVTNSTLGQHDDARMCLDIAFTACRYGAAIANYVEVTDLLKGPCDDPKQKDANGNPKLVVNGARMKDLLTGKEFTVHARCVVNAAGPFTDDIRKMENKEIKSICQPSSGIHIVLPNYYRQAIFILLISGQILSACIHLNYLHFSPENMGLLDPSTTDGRVIFFLPWLGHVVAGTTDHPCEVTTSPEPTDDDVQFILSEIKSYLSTDLKGALNCI